MAKAIWEGKECDVRVDSDLEANWSVSILSGEYDPITPPGYGWSAAQTLKHSFYYQFPGIGHGVSIGDLCPYDVTLAFWDKPTVKPDIACVSIMIEPQFKTR